MPIQVICSKCGTRLNAPDQAAGKRVRCKCGEAISVPGAAATTTTAPASGGAQQRASGTTATPPQAASSSKSAMFNVLTDRDLQQSQVNPYTPVSRAANNDAAALRNYLKADEKKAAEAKSAQTNVILLTVAFFIGVAKNIFTAIALLALGSLLAQAAEMDPLIRAGSVYVAIVLVYAAFDLAAGIGLLLRKPWGWWLSVIGLSWAALERVCAAVAVTLLAEEKAKAIGAIVGGLIFCILCFSLLAFMIKPETQKRFGLVAHPGLAWAVSITVGLVLTGAAFGIGYAVGLDAIDADLVAPVAAPAPGP